MSQSTK